MQRIGRQIQIFNIILVGQEAVDVLELVHAQPHVGQLGQRLEGGLFQSVQAVPGHVQVSYVGGSVESVALKKLRFINTKN